MTRTPGRRSLTPTIYFAIVIMGGGAALTLSVLSLLGQPPGGDFYYLAALIVISGYVSVKLPNVSANISVSETFIFAGMLLYGPPAGILLVFLDALLIWVNLARRNLRWYRMLFSLAASGLSIGIAGTALFRLVGTEPLARVPIANRPELLSVAGGLIAFVALYYGLNSSLIAFAISHEQQVPARAIWQKNFSKLWLNYLAGASIALLLVYNTQGLTWAFLIVILPVIVVLFLTYQWSGERIERAERHVEEMNRTFLETIEAMAMAIDAKDQVTSGHIRRVQRNAMAVARELGITDTRSLDALRAAALLHDTGKLAVPEHILNKPGRLTPAEFNRMKLHATIGADILKSISFPYPVVPLVRHHHENWDGTGYPDGLRGQDIPLGARILAVVDCFDAVTSDRPYRSRMRREQAEQILVERRGTMYDPLVVDAFLRILNKLEAADATEVPAGRDLPEPVVGIAEELRAIAATRVEDRQFSSLKRELPSATTISAAAELVFRHVTPLVPSATLVIYAPVPDADELAVLACTGTRAAMIRTLVVPIGERMAGWVFANREAVVNSEAALDLGTIARGASPPLEYALVVPVIDSDRAAGVVAVYGPEPFTEDQQRIVESAADLLRLTVLSAASPIRNAVD